MSTRPRNSIWYKALVLVALAPLALAATTAGAQNTDSSGPAATGSAQSPRHHRRRHTAPPAPTLSGTPLEVVGPAASASVDMPPTAKPPRKTRGAVADLRQVVSTPGFWMLPNGGSRIEVNILGNPKVLQYLTPGAVVYVFQNASVPVSNNRNALVTRFFNTPVADVRLRQVGQDVHLTVDLRTEASPQPRIIEVVPNRVLALQIDFAPGAYYSQPVADPRRGNRSRGSQSSGNRSRSDSSPTSTGGSVLGPPAP